MDNRQMQRNGRKHDMFNMYNKVREVAGLYTRKTSNMLVDNTGRLFIDEHEVLEAWSGYIAELLDDNRSDQPDTTVSVEGPEILKSEIL